MSDDIRPPDLTASRGPSRAGPRACHRRNVHQLKWSRNRGDTFFSLKARGADVSLFRSGLVVAKRVAPIGRFWSSRTSSWSATICAAFSRRPAPTPSGRWMTRARPALFAVQRPIDGALLDVRLGERSCLEVADLLERRHIPFIVVTGYNREHIPRALRAAPFVGKPVLRAPLLSLAQTIFLPASRT
jgi:CheY-like chemotaxis protein